MREIEGLFVLNCFAPDSVHYLMSVISAAYSCTAAVVIKPVEGSAGQHDKDHRVQDVERPRAHLPEFLRISILISDLLSYGALSVPRNIFYFDCHLVGRHPNHPLLHASLGRLNPCNKDNHQSRLKDCMLQPFHGYVTNRLIIDFRLGVTTKNE